MPQTTLFIDGENFLHKVEEVLRDARPNSQKLAAPDINLKVIAHSALSSFDIGQMRFYAAKLHLHADTQDKSRELIAAQRRLRNRLVGQGVEFIIAGNVRAQSIETAKPTRILFREKGVDVKLAVDLVAFACDKTITTAMVCSSDSDLQPAIQELKRRQVEVVYLGFEMKPNKGLMYTADRTILLRNSEIIKACELNGDNLNA